MVRSMAYSRIPFVLCGLCLHTLLLGAARAAAQVPEVSGIFPPGGPRGGVCSIRVEGSGLTGARIVLSGRGIQVVSVVATPAGDAATAKLNVAPDAPVGPRELRVVTERGASNPARIWIDPYPHLAEAEPNDELSAAQALPRTPVTIAGRIRSATDVDRFGFDVKANETWVFDCVAKRVLSGLEPRLEVTDSAGTVVGTAAAAAGDPRVVFRATKPGRYFAVMRGNSGAGGYLLSCGMLPLVKGLMPYAVQPGKTTGVVVSGINLTPLVRAEVAAPADAPAAGFWATFKTPRGPALPFLVPLDPLPSALITETDATMPLPLLPGHLDGAFVRWPRTRFFFAAEPNERLTFELRGMSPETSLAPVLRVLDPEGKELASASGKPGELARLAFTSPADAVYTLEGESAGGAEGKGSPYRLTVRKAERPLQLFLDAVRIEVRQGATARVSAVVRGPGFTAGELSFRAEGLPQGVSISSLPPEIGQGELKIPLVFTAARDAKPGTYFIRIFRGGTSGLGASRQVVIPRAQLKGAAGEESWEEWELLPLTVLPAPPPGGK